MTVLLEVAREMIGCVNSLYGQAVHLPGHTQTSSSIILFRPVCLKADRLNHSSHLHTVTQLLASNPYVIVRAIDFSKAFDTVRHQTLLDKMSQLDIPDTG